MPSEMHEEYPLLLCREAIPCFKGKTFIAVVFFFFFWKKLFEEV